MKTKVFIDFEAISHLQVTRFKGLGKFYQFPYAFSVGVDTPSGFKTQTFIFDFSKGLTIGRANWLLKRRLLTFINNLLDNKKRLTIKDIVFYGYTIKMEQDTLNKIFNNKVDVVDLSFSNSASLTRLTKKYIPDKNYFEYLKNEWLNDPSLIGANRRNRSGEFASLAGLALLLHKTNTKQTLFKNIDLKQLTKEILQYSKDDVLRIKCVFDHEEEMRQESQAWNSYIKKREKTLQEISLIESVINLFSQYGDKSNIDEIIELEISINEESASSWTSRKINKLNEVKKDVEKLRGTKSPIDLLSNQLEAVRNELDSFTEEVKHLL